MAQETDSIVAGTASSSESDESIRKKKILGPLFKKYKFTNTRYYLRLPISWPVKYRPVSELSGENRQVAATKDVSAGGLRVTVPRQMPLHSRVSMEIYVPPLDKTISVRGEVVRCIASAAGGYEIGLRFEEIDPEDRLALNHSIKRSRSPKEHVRHRRSWWRRVS